MPAPAAEDDLFAASGLIHALQTYLEPEQIEQARRAYEFGAAAHQGQRRLSGEPYITHPLAVAGILAGMRMNVECIQAAILHDVIEDTDVTKEDIEARFGAEVAEMVDGVSKLTQIRFETHMEEQAENFRKMLLATVQDIRVIIIKLADRLHNMRTLGAMPAAKRRRIARETLDIYAPIANRLGMNNLRTELQELGFAEAYPLRHRILAEAVRRARGNRKEVVAGIREAIAQRLEQEGLQGEVQGREKHLYSIYQKMRSKHLSFSEVFDVYAFRIIVDSVDACYRVLGVIHNLYKPVPGRFKDYIAIPKANGYQSLHTVLFGPYGLPIEVQIRSEDMQKVAEAGVAAHWLYKLGDSDHTHSNAQKRIREWMRGLLELQKNAGNSLDFLENVKIDLFPDEVYVFTPKGNIMALPRGATAVDFAYTVHTDVGNTCVAAKIDRHLSPLSSPLQNGQTVEIITAPGARPNPTWLNFVVTAKARTTIRNYLKNLKREESRALGRRLLEQALRNYNLTLEDLHARSDTLLAEFKSNGLEGLFEDIGLGNRLAPLVARRLEEMVADEHGHVPRRPRAIRDVFVRYMPAWLGGSRGGEARPLAIRGTEGMVVTFAKCCHPIPGDPIQGFVSAGRGIVVHTESCKNIKEFRKHPEKWVTVQWESDIKQDFPVDIRVYVVNRRGVLATVAAAISEMDINISNVVIEEHDSKYSSIIFTVAVRDRVHLARLMRHIRAIDMVVRISRKKG
ncbi:MAG TPA: bifunctional GTP diphosphokinase/guanosine-3',5'-bis pyrophosphate 3'-pyrophosphohydrolase [Gammaproteobacteria bacterium]|nr:bifunctional GTP diphosphokinase/guanosine-3',5'-bis pyrophosphate 3'-pyrophosphohydrolase [Gammaproteobacteria bacterium]